MKTFIRAAAALALVIPVSAHAHKAWLLPSSTVLSGSGNDLAVTIDAAASNDLFYFDHRPLPLDGLVVTAPDGSKVAPENASTGKYRSSFDLALKAPGTYRVSLVNDNLFASYKENGAEKRWRGKAENLAKEIPASATDLKVTQSTRRLETFVTAGKPDEAALKPVGNGLEMVPVTHPNDLVEGDEAEFKLLLDGKPAADVKVEIVRGGIRYRNQLGDTTVTTDKDGVFKFKWPEPGMYWLEASVTDDKTTIKEAKERRAGYAATLEVLPE
ncbi:MAG TPA: DUF4198 domain-containing protein [Hyphomicrobium sp.]|nr:DUF4198 domain-containing protein [Hyphomicrobium sp.]